MFDEAPTKTCTACGITFPATTEFFYKHSRCRYGVTSTCKTCTNQKNKDAFDRRKAREPDAVKALARDKAKKWYGANIERAREISRLSAKKARENPEKRLKIQARKRAGGAGLTPEKLENMFQAQGCVCAICASDNPGSKIGWNVDHCHESGRVRFILCAHCNRGLGAFRDSPVAMRKAADLLEAFYAQETSSYQEPHP